MNNINNFNRFLAPAKLNLGLKIVGKLPNGYHILKTVFCLISLYDQIDIQITDTAQIFLIDHQSAWHYTDDLAYKAASMLLKYSNTKLGANIKIKKIIPSGSGMGGGSSDAALVLNTLNKLWNINLPHYKLLELGNKLGADIPFFILGKNSFAEGTGDILSSIELPKAYFVVVMPDFYIPTKKIFGGVDPNLIASNTLNIESITPDSLITTLHNDLFYIAKKLYPQLVNIEKDLLQFGTPAMTGSGSALYLRFYNQDTAKKVAKKLENRYNTYLVEGIL